MADPRDTARTWLAETIRRMPWFDEMWDNAPNDIADAILTAPSIQVEEDRIRRFPQEAGDDEPMEVRNPRHMRITHTQVVIRLPAQPIEDGRDG